MTTKAPQLSSKQRKRLNMLGQLDPRSEPGVTTVVTRKEFEQHLAQELERQRERWVEKVESEHKKLTKELRASEYRVGMDFMKAASISIIKNE